MATTSDFALGDKVRHLSDPHGRNAGVVIMHNHDRGLIRVEWGSGVREWVTPDELREVE